jgi:hypothetical protein
MVRLVFVLALITAVLVGCGARKNRDELLKKFVERALTERYLTNDYESYLNEVDYGVELDTVQQQMVIAMHKQFADYQEKKHGTVAYVRMTDVVKEENDSACFVHYIVVYSDSTEESAVMKVVEENGEWKIKSRN